MRFFYFRGLNVNVLLRVVVSAGLFDFIKFGFFLAVFIFRRVLYRIVLRG